MSLSTVWEKIARGVDAVVVVVADEDEEVEEPDAEAPAIDVRRSTKRG